MKLTGLQIFWIIITFSVGNMMLLTVQPAIATAKQDVWISYLLASIGGVLLVFIANKVALLYPKNTFIQYSKIILGKGFGTIIIFIFFIQWYSVIADILCELADFVNTILLPTTPPWILHVTMLLLLMYVCYLGGIEGIARCSEVFGPIIVISIEGEGVQDLQDVFLQDWQLAAKVRLQYRDPYFPTLEKGPYRHQVIPSEGIYLEKTFSKLIRQAKKSILIGTPYFIPGKQVFADLQAALKRGVKLEILVPGTADHPLVKEASYPYFRTLIPLGATVFQYQRGFYHAKILMIDDQICDIGTANFDKRSFYLNQEINCYTYDQSYIGETLEVLRYDQSHAKQLNLKDIQSINPWAVFKEYTARALSLFL